MLNYVRPARIFMRNHPQFDERWVQERIAEDPSLLGLGNLIVRDKERPQPNAGRLDLLLRDRDTDHRYEVEIQLGKTDESHIIRTIEYWDLERKRYPQYEHTAVIIAEEITGRFLNVVSLFNGHLPLVAIQMQAFQLEDQVFLIFTTVLNEMSLGADDEDEEIQEPTVDRQYWVSRSSEDIVQITDQIEVMVRSFDDAYRLNYRRNFIGLARHGQPNNFVVMTPLRNRLNVGVRFKRSDVSLERLEEFNKKLDEARLDWNYNDRRYRIQLTVTEFQNNEGLIRDLIKASYEQYDR